MFKAVYAFIHTPSKIIEIKHLRQHVKEIQVQGYSSEGMFLAF
jgi:hypothetical protein